MGKLVCFGELLLRFSPDADGSWISNNSMPVFIGGAELNVATALANWQQEVIYCTALPDNAITEHLRGYLRGKKIDDTHVYLSGERVGTYYMPQGSDLKNASVIYDRAGSSFYQLKPGMIDWDEVLKEVSWFHFSAISPALNDSAVAVCLEAVKAASAKSITVSVDLNYRSKLWKYGKEPVQMMPSLIEHCDVVMGNIWSANTLLGTFIDEDIHARKSDDAYLAHATATSEELFQRFPKCKMMANTFRFDAGEGIHYYAALNTKTEQYVSPQFNSSKVIDKAGSGDCFMAGLMYGLTNNKPLPEVLDFAAAATFGKLHQKGDASSMSVDDVYKILATVARFA